MELTGVAAGIVAVTVLAGCGGPSSDSKANTDKDYLSLAYVALGSDVSHTAKLDKSLVSTGHQLCSSFDKGMSWGKAKTLLNQGMSETTPAQNTLLMAAAVGAYCPKHKHLAPAGTFDS